MSYQVMAWARGIKTGSIAVKAVLMAIANYADENGVSWPSQQQLAEDVEASRHTVLRALDVLAEGGILKRERRHREDGSRSSDRIILNLSYVADSNVAQSNVAGNNVATDPEPMLHAATAEPVRESPKNPPSPPAGGAAPDKVSSDDVRDAFDAYNVVAQSLGLPKARDLTAERRRRIRSRLAASGGLETWREALDKIRTSDFLTGRTERGFLADIDFLCQAKSFQRLIEGFYSERGRGPPDGNNVTEFDKAQLEERLYGKTG